MTPNESGLLPAIRSTASAIIRQLRPRQWLKNAAVLAPLLFARRVFVEDSTLRALSAALAFCFAASAVYVINDWNDRVQDRLHPDKRLRPIAAGQIGGRLALGLVAALTLLALSFAAYPNRGVLAVVLGYLLLQLTYSLGLKRLVIIDVLIIAVGFVLRVIAGGLAVTVPVSNWLFLCTLLIALFLGFAKRRQELASLQGVAADHRENLSEYSLAMLDQFIAISAAACILAYGLYSVSEETVRHVGSDGMKFTVPIVIYGFLRYLFLMHRRNEGGSPERVLLSDAPLLVSVLAFVGVVAFVLYGSTAS